MTINQETAQLLKKVAAVFRIKEGDTFRYKAYINASVAIENLTEPITELWKQNALDTIPGLGESLTAYLSEYFKTGHVKHFDAQLKKVPAGMFELMNIRGIGPITAYKIAKKFDLKDPKTAMSELKDLLNTGKLSKIAGFKERTILKIKKALAVRSVRKDRISLYDAIEISDAFIKYLIRSPQIFSAEPLGSLRRKLATIGDIDLAICSSNPKKAMNYALSYPEIAAVMTKGDMVSHVKLKNGFEVDIKLSLPNAWGSLLQHYTGSKLHNIHLRNLALEKNLSLSEYGIKKGKKEILFKSETSFYKFLGLEFIPPELRENTGEIELAKAHRLPKLIELKDIKGDFHIHSDFSYESSHDYGISPLSDILKMAETLHYEYLGLTDHNPKFAELTENKKINIINDRKKYLESQFRAYEKSVKHRTIKLLIGMEVDIRPDGSLALSDKCLDLLDYVIVSIHSSFELSESQNTERIIKALSHKKAIILGHPTGREIDKREPISANWEKIFDFCVKNKKILEINAFPNRLDLPDDLIRKAVSKGIKLIIDTDTHSVDQMPLMKYGVWQARRGYAEKKDIVNTFSYDNLRRVLEL